MCKETAPLGDAKALEIGNPGLRQDPISEKGKLKGAVWISPLPSCSVKCAQAFFLPVIGLEKCWNPVPRLRAPWALHHAGGNEVFWNLWMFLVSNKLLTNKQRGNWTQNQTLSAVAGSVYTLFLKKSNRMTIVDGTAALGTCKEGQKVCGWSSTGKLFSV